MKTISLGKSGLTVPALAVGCMRINGKDAEPERLVKSALDAGLNFFDHADIYGGGACETVFAKAIGMTASVREKIIIQDKCGIVPGKMYDFSKEHILQAVDGCLARLSTDYLDVLLLHRPDALIEPEEVAAAVDTLHTQGKIRAFGVSNHNPGQIRLLQKYVSLPIAANQLQLSITNAAMIGAGLHVNMTDDASVDRDGGVLDFCRLNDITVQTWSPFQFGFFEGVFLGNAKFGALNAKIDCLAAKYHATPTAIAAAWIFRHPARFQLICGSTKPERLAECAAGADIALTREEWYALYLAAGNTLP